MAIITTGTDVDVANALRVNRDEAQQKQWLFIYDWEPKSDVWALRSAPGTVGSVAGISGMILNQFYRRKLKCGKLGYLSSYLPLIVLPAVFTGYIHGAVVGSEIILEPFGCPLCYEGRAMAIQSIMGVMYPLIFAPLCGYMIASRYNTTRLPMIQEPKKLWNFHLQTTRPLYSRVYGLVALNLIVAAFITHYEQKNVIRVITRMKQIEDEVIAKGLPLTDD